MGPRLRCRLTREPEDSAKDVNELWFEREEGKKSSFLVETSTCSVEKPVHVILDCCGPNGQPLPFIMGGFELVSNARNIEAYVIEEKEDKETYLMTCRGVKVGETDDWHKCILVCPGGPRPFQRIRLKLLSLRPPKSTTVTFRSIKLKGRLPDASNQAASEPTTTTTTTTKGMTNPATTSQQVPSGSPQPPASGLSKADISAAMTGVSMLVRSTEERLIQAMTSGFQQLDASTGAKIHSLERNFGTALASQVKTMQQLENVLGQQQQIIQSQSEALHEMKRQQTQLVDLVSKLQQQVADQQEVIVKFHQDREDKDRIEEQARREQHKQILDSLTESQRQMSDQQTMLEQTRTDMAGLSKICADIEQRERSEKDATSSQAQEGGALGSDTFVKAEAPQENDLIDFLTEPLSSSSSPEAGAEGTIEEKRDSGADDQVKGETEVVDLLGVTMLDTNREIDGETSGETNGEPPVEEKDSPVQEPLCTTDVQAT